MRVFLDDRRPAPEGWRLVLWPDEVINLLKSGVVEELSLDHDLGDDARGTGYDVLKWIEEAVATRGFVPPPIKIHSANVSARVRMELALASIENLARQRRPTIPDDSEVLGDFFMLLGAAQHAAQAVDYFDLHSEDAASARKFEGLKREQADDVGALVNYVKARGDAVVAALGEDRRRRRCDDEDEGEDDDGGVRLNHVLERVMSLTTEAGALVPIADVEAVFTVKQRRTLRGALRIMRGQGSVEVIEDGVRVVRASLVDVIDTIDLNPHVNEIILAERAQSRRREPR